MKSPFSVFLWLEITLIFSNEVSANKLFLLNCDELKEKWYNMGLSVIFFYFFIFLFFLFIAGRKKRRQGRKSNHPIIIPPDFFS